MLFILILRLRWLETVDGGNDFLQNREVVGQVKWSTVELEPIVLPFILYMRIIRI